LANFNILPGLASFTSRAPRLPGGPPVPENLVASNLSAQGKKRKESFQESCFLYKASIPPPPPYFIIFSGKPLKIKFIYIVNIP
jgi:hypothetical protein